MTRRQLVELFLDDEDSYHDFKSLLLENHPDHQKNFSYHLIDKIDKTIKESFKETLRDIYLLLEGEVNSFEYENLRIGFQVGFDLAMVLMGEPQHYNSLWKEEISKETKASNEESTAIINNDDITEVKEENNLD